MTGLAVAAAALAWLGAATTTLAEGRRGLALGLLLTGLGLAGVTVARSPTAAAVLALAGLVAGALRLRDGAPGWRVMPPGSTPGIVASVVVLVASAVLAGVALQRPNPSTFAPFAVVTISAIRVLNAGGRQAVLAAASALALGLGALGNVTDAVAAGLVAAVLGMVPAEGAQEVAG